MYRLIDQRIISGLVQDVANRTISAQECGDILSQRRSGFWYEEFEDLYLAVGDAAQFISELDGLNLTMTSLLDGVQRYSRQWYVIDQLYRKFIYHVRKSSQHTLMQHLSARIENLYSNNYLLTLNDNWQIFVDQAESWSVPGVLRQRDFFTDRVQPYLDRNNKIFVIVSDALRYEIAEEFVRLIRKEDRYEAEIEPARDGTAELYAVGDGCSAAAYSAPHRRRKKALGSSILTDNKTREARTIAPRFSRRHREAPQFRQKTSC